MRAILNAMTIDVEDYFHVSAFSEVVSPSKWLSYESRVCQNTERVLRIFDQTGVRATFFVLGWVADRFPALVKRIHAAGHELASHSYDHALVYEKTPESFRDDLRKAKSSIEQAVGVPVRGYRAPSFSITSRSLWALQVLISEGYTFDSSIYPIHHHRYGIPGGNRHIHEIRTANGALWELPVSTVRDLGQNLPVGGGGYFRLLPYWWTRRGFNRVNSVEKKPVIFYLHPWELDPDQPRLKVGRIATVRHYGNLNATERRLRRLLKEFRFGTVSQVLSQGQIASAASSFEPRFEMSGMHVSG